MKVRFTRTAQRDLAEIYEYVSQDSSTIASRFVTQLYTIVGDEVQIMHIRHTSRRRPSSWGR